MIHYLIFIFTNIALWIPISYAAQTESIVTSLVSVEVANERLFKAIKDGSLEDVKAAFAAGAQIEAKNEHKLTPLIVAAGRGNEEVVRYLVEEKRANVYAVTDDGNWTPFIAAAYVGRLAIVKYLIEERGIIDKIDRSGYTSFYLAAEQGHLDIVQYFAERNEFNPHIEGVVAMSLAYRNKDKKHQSIIDYLIARGIPAIPKAGEALEIKSLFYSEKANAQIDFGPLSIIAYDATTITASSEIALMAQGGTMYFYQLKVLSQNGTNEPCVKQQLEEAVKKMGGTPEMHCNANPILGGSCSYHAVKNAVLSLVMLNDYEELVLCSERDEKSCQKNAAWVSSDIENLITLKTKSFDCEKFMENLQAKTLALKSGMGFGLNLIEIRQGSSYAQYHISRHDIDKKIVSILESRYKAPAAKYENSFSFVNEETINNVQKNVEIEQALMNCSQIYEQRQPLADMIEQIEITDLLKQIALFRRDAKYRHAFILTLNEGSLNGYGVSAFGHNRMHAIAVIIDKQGSIVNAIVCESNNMPTFAVKEIVVDFLNLFIDGKKCALSNEQIKQIERCNLNNLGHWITKEEEELPSFESLVKAYEDVLTEYKHQKDSDNLQQALFLLSKIEYLFDRAKARTDSGEDKEIFEAIKKLLPNRLRSGVREEEIALYKMLQEAADKELNDKWGEVIWMGNLEKVKELLQIGARINARNDQGDTPLLIAARAGNLDILSYLHSQGASLEEADSEGETALMIAAERGNVAILEYLIKKDANANAKDKNGNTALMYAACGYHDKKFDIIKMLIEQGNADQTVVNNDGQTAFMISTYLGPIEVVKYFMNKFNMRIDLDATVNFIINAKRTINRSLGTPPLPLDIADFLVREHGLTAQKNLLATVKVFMAAAKNYKIDIIKRLLEPDCGLNVDVQDEEGWTALMYATKNGDEALIKYLKDELHADTQKKNNAGQIVTDIDNEYKAEQESKRLSFWRDRGIY